MALYAANGSINVTVVSGSAITGRYAANGSLNVVVASGSSPCGFNHPCGAVWVTLATSGPKGIYAPDGSMYVRTSATNFGGLYVTEVSGSLSGGSTAGSPIGLLLALTKAA